MRIFFALVAALVCSACQDDGLKPGVDAAVADLPGVDLPAPGAGRTCAQAIDLTNETEPLAASTLGGISQTGTACDSGSDNYPEVYFHFEAGAIPVDLIVDVVVDPNSRWDAVVTSRSDCARPDSESFCADNGGSQHLEVLGATGEVYLLVDGTDSYMGKSQGSFTIAVHERPIVALGDACDPNGVDNRCSGQTRCEGGTCVATSAALECAGAAPISFSGGEATISGVLLPFDPGYFVGSCSFAQDPAAPERIYSFHVDAPATLDADADFSDGTDFDTVLYVTRGSCDGAEVACNDDVNYDAGQFRSHLLTNLQPGDYFLVVDTASPAIYGAFDREARHYKVVLSLAPLASDGGPDL